MSNVEFTYIYRDGGNYKRFGRVIFSNPEQTDRDTIETALRQLFLDDGLFIADQVRLPEVFLYADGAFSFDDHCYHEFQGVQPTNKNLNDKHARSIGEFLTEVSQEAQRGWRVFDPYDSEGSIGHFLAS